MPTSVAAGTDEPEEGKRGVVYLISRFILRPLFLLVFRPHVTGRENVPATGPFIIASNHLSFIDSMAIPLMSPRRVGYLAKAEYFTGPGIGGWLTKTLFTALGALPVERETHRAAQEALDTAMTVLNAGRRLRHLPGGHPLPRRPARPRQDRRRLAGADRRLPRRPGRHHRHRPHPADRRQLAAPAPLHGDVRRSR